MRAVVGRGCTDLAGDLHARTLAELVGMHARLQPDRLTRKEDLPRLIGIERAPLTEDIDPFAVRAGLLEHRSGHEIDIGRRVVGILRRHHMCAEEGRLVGEVARDRQRPRLIADRQPVATLDLDGRGALSQHLGDQPRDVGGQGLVAGARVAATVVRIPPAEYGLPSIRAANSSARSPANTRCAWLST